MKDIPKIRMLDSNLFSMPPPREYPSGTVVNDRYELLRKLGRDGQVYEAHDRNMEKRVALKILEPVSGVAQTWGEAQRLEHLRNRYIVPVINADVIGSSDLRFIVTDLLEGGDLESAAAGTGFGLRQGVAYMRQIAAGIDRIHAADMVHRDVKPANVLLRGDDVVVSDLEFCHILNADGRTSPMGSFCTVAPEVLGEQGYCSVSSDVYSLGSTAFYLLSGEYPVDHRISKSEQQQLILKGELRDLRTLAPHVPGPTATVINRALSSAPGRRQGSAEDFGNALVHSIRNSRDWRRVTHEGHKYCLKGARLRNRAPVDLCCASSGLEIIISARHSQNGRRVQGVAETRTTAGKLSRELQRLIATLS